MDETTKAAMESGRPLTIFNIREVHQLNPNATHVTNHYYGDQFVPKEVQPVHSEGDQPWDFFGRTDAKAETLILWPPHAKS